MGVLNVTPDSFSDGGRWLDHQRAAEHGLRLVTEGADVVDVGGESTRPGARPVPEDEERRRILPVVAALAPHVRVSVDTRKAAVAEAAVEAGATIVNDVSARLGPVAAAAGAGWVAMHLPADPSVMAEYACSYHGDVVADVTAYLTARAEEAWAAGVGEVWIDPGIGFGKTAAHNLRLLRHLDQLVATGWPVAIGTSRKSFLGPLSVRQGEPPAPPAERLEASVATAAWAALQGAAMVRVHDVAATVQAIRLVRPAVSATGAPGSAA
ncbi:MAG: dihydropteroate synthase [Actinomycetota bacterium]|jgi:dihydropteroate synthase|nr:dihydropteroate synthase [Actinomycetota bacterium]